MIENPKTVLAASLLVFILCLFPPCRVLCDPLGSNGIATPAFISAGSTPNLLILMDNSASMGDLAHTGGNPGGCYDGPGTGETDGGGYTPSRAYSGYFETGAWYGYHAAGSRFEPVDERHACSSETGRAFAMSSGGVQELCVRPDDKDAVFEARGNFMNWVSASRLDVLKQILTGGKFDPDTRSLVSEGRGCSGDRFFKQAPVREVDSGALYYLTLGVRAMDADPDTVTAIEIYPPIAAAFDARACRIASRAFHTPTTPLETLAGLLEPCAPDDPVTAADGPCQGSLKQSILACRQWFEMGFDGDAAALGPFMSQCQTEPPADIPEYENPLCTCDPEALVDFCETINVPSVIDPTDRIDAEGRVDNLPGILTQAGIEGQLGTPLHTMKGIVYDTRYAAEAPAGLVHEFAGELNMGLMRFNAGAAGGRVVVEIGNGTPEHIDRIIEHINGTGAETWTPLAESVFNALGYFTQRPDMRINPDDFETTRPPCRQWCQNNNLLVITDGASAADLHPKMTTFASVEGQNDGSSDDISACDSLQGGTFLDDICAFGFEGDNIFLETPYDPKAHFQNIRTHFILTGTPPAYGTGECNPRRLIEEAAVKGGTGAPYFAENPQNFETDLKNMFSVIRPGAASGAAVSILSDGRSGEGAVVQASFWPEVDGAASGQKVLWTGDVHTLLVDTFGNLYEDTDENRSLTIADQAVVVYYDTDLQESRACSQPLEAGVCVGDSKPLGSVEYLWSAAEWLADIDEADLDTNRPDYISDTHKRYIFTWNDLDNEGDVDHDEVLAFEPRDDWSEGTLQTAQDRAPVPVDFTVSSSEEVNRIIRWIRGRDNIEDPALRSRNVATPPNFDLSDNPPAITWRLGDVVHATPTVVSRPAEGYHLLNDDMTYAAFAGAHARRRHMIYFGGNDGMVHAVNGGFYDEKQKKFWGAYDEHSGVFSDTGPALGAELWAYVPYNLLPHLKSLTDPGYRHRYFVDLKPRVFDVQIFESTPDRDGHVAGWGTILVVGMRLGGSRIAAREIMKNLGLEKNLPPDKRIFSSAYMVFDISDPENPPKLLGELTFDPDFSVDLAYTLTEPAVVPIKTEKNGSDWFLILGSGPTHVDGTSTQSAKIAVFPLKGFDSWPPTAFRIPDSAVYTHAHAGSFNLTGSPRGFVSQIVAADFDVESLYKSDVIYFGTVEGGWDGWNGRIYRWVTDETHPQAWQNPGVMFDAQRPISAGPGIGFDGNFFWLYFGTGRFFSPRDKMETTGGNPDCFFGLKEPVDAETGRLTWGRVDYTVSNTKPPPENNAGSRTLLRVDPITVGESTTASRAVLECRDGSDCLPEGVASFEDLKGYIAGACDMTGGCSGTDGWVRELTTDRERSLSPSALLGGLLTFTTYSPSEDICKPGGEAFLYGVHYQTGTAYHETVFTNQAVDGDTPENGVASTPMTTPSLSIGQGLAMAPSLHLGQNAGTKAFVQTSTGTIVEIPQSSLPVDSIKSGRLSWRSY